MLPPDYVPVSVDQTAVVTSASTRTDNVRGTAQTVTSDVIGSVEAASRLLRLQFFAVSFVLHASQAAACANSPHDMCLRLSCLLSSSSSSSLTGVSEGWF